MYNESANGSMGTNNAVVRKHVYTVTERGEKSFWVKVGAAFVNRDNSLTVRLDAIPVNGVLQIRDEDYNARPRGAEDGGAVRGRMGGAQ